MRKELDSVFISWFLNAWAPDNAEKNQRDHLTEMPVGLSFLAENEAEVDPFAKRFIEECCARLYSFLMVADLDHGA